MEAINAITKQTTAVLDLEDLLALLAGAHRPAHAIETSRTLNFRGDLSDAVAVRAAVTGADVVVHAAAKVGDWGATHDYRAVNVDGLRNLLEACRAHPVKRFVHLSSLGVYAARHHYQTDESEPISRGCVEPRQTWADSTKLRMIPLADRRR